MKILSKIFLIVVAFVNLAFSQIITTNSIESLKLELNRADENTLIIFDCDDTLITKTDAILRKDNVEKLKRCILFALIKHPLAYFRVDKLKWIAWKNYEQVLVNKDLKDLVADLQSSNIRVIMLTAMISKTTNEGRFIDLRIEEQHKFGFDFSKNWNNLKEAALIEGEEGPYYKEGIVSSAPKTKSEALELFLKYSGFIPKKIIFIDDTKSNLEDVKTFCEKAGIEFLGIEYLEYKKIPYKYPFSKKRANFQIDYLIENEKWLSDEEAERFLKQQAKSSE